MASNASTPQADAKTEHQAATQAPAQPAPQGRLAAAVAGLFPGYFALVMATGIVSIGAHLLGMPYIAWPLLVINAAAYIVLWLLTIWRLAAFFGRIRQDFQTHARGPGFLTLVAGTCVLGMQALLVAGQHGAAWGLWLLGISLWLLILYGFFTAVITAKTKPPLENGLNGAWLIAVVATQSLVVLGAPLLGGMETPPGWAFLAVLCCYLLGCLLYLILITLIVYRLTFFPLTGSTFTPPYWINMGAIAITTLAGSLLILNADHWSLLGELLPFLKGFTLFFWAGATWWIPLLLILGIWRHAVQRVPLTYDPQYWSMVFPLGMYTVCTIRLAQALELPFVMLIPQVFFWPALLAWVATSVGLVGQLVRRSEP